MSATARAQGFLGTLPIRRKVVLIAMASTVIGLFLAGLAFAGYERYRTRRSMARNLSSLATLVGERSRAALASGDARLAEEDLATLRVMPSVDQACIYAADGAILARYEPSGATRAPFPPAERAAVQRFEPDGLSVFAPVTSGGRTIGMVFVRAGLGELDRAWLSYLGFAGLIVLLAGAAAFALSSRLQQIVSAPIADLADTARQIAEARDYSKRATAAGGDETAVLVQSFNTMLETIDAQNRDLVEANWRLEQRVMARTRELLEAKDRAEAADRVKSLFLATMSHELRTPLNSIIGFTGILLQELGGPINDEQRKQLTMVKSSAQHLLTLISDVLDISKIEAGQLTVGREPFDLRASIAKVVQSVRPLAARQGIELREEAGVGSWSCLGDARRVEQVLLNLLSNAVKFTERGSVRVRCEQHPEGFAITVTDTGIGIADADLKRLFEPFRQLDTGLSRKYDGTGLGLSISRKLVELMGGSIWVESEKGKGSRFGFTLPPGAGGA